MYDILFWPAYIFKYRKSELGIRQNELTMEAVKLDLCICNEFKVIFQSWSSRLIEMRKISVRTKSKTSSL